MVFPVVPEMVVVVAVANGAVDVRTTCARLDRLEGGVLQRDHVIEQLALLSRGLTDHHRSFELGEIAPDGSRRSGYQDVALLKDDVVRKRVRNGGVAADLAAVAGACAVEEEALC